MQASCDTKKFQEMFQQKCESYSLSSSHSLWLCTGIQACFSTNSYSKNVLLPWAYSHCKNSVPSEVHMETWEPDSISWPVN